MVKAERESGVDLIYKYNIGQYTLFVPFPLSFTKKSLVIYSFITRTRTMSKWVQYCTTMKVMLLF